MKLLIVTDLSFPTGSAMSSRLNSFCLLFKELNYDIHVIAGKSEGKQYTYNKIYNTKNYSFEIVYSERSEQLQSFIGNENLAGRVDEYLSDNSVDLVFFNSLGALFNKVLKICKKHNVKTLLEQCEWYDSSTFRFNKLDLRYIRFTNNIRNNYKKVDGIISISRLLNDYYKLNGVKTLRIPSLFDVKNNEYNVKLENNKIKLIYTGSPSKSKELLKPIIKSLYYFDNIELDIYGLDKEEVLNNIDNVSLTDNIKVHGRVSYEELKKAILNANYSIFIKPKRRSSDAQFPTKLAESMSFGTPVITNKTGDIELYVKDGINGFICKEDELFYTMKKISEVDNKNYNRLRENARKTALNYFDYRIYKKEMKEFIEKL